MGTITLDYDLTAEFEPWKPPKPFDENTYAFPDRVFTLSELLSYARYCGERVSRALDDDFEVKAASINSSALA